MTIDEYIRTHNFSPLVKKGGIIFLINKWKSRVERIPYNSKYLFDEWVNDLLTRSVIEEIFLNCMIPDNIRQQVERIDEQYKLKTIALSEIGKEDFIFMKEWDKEHYWFAYRIPPERINDWIAYYADPVYFSDN